MRDCRGCGLALRSSSALRIQLRHAAAQSRLRAFAPPADLQWSVNRSVSRLPSTFGALALAHATISAVTAKSSGSLMAAAGRFRPRGGADAEGGGGGSFF